jgi:hypothetical protein
VRRRADPLRPAGEDLPPASGALEVVQESWLIVLRDLDCRSAKPSTPPGPLFAAGRFRPLDDQWPRQWAIGPAPSEPT